MRVPRLVLAILAILTLGALVFQVAAGDAPQIARAVTLFVLTADLVALGGMVFGPRRG